MNGWTLTRVWQVDHKLVVAKTIEDAIAWLEKQGEQKPIDKVEPKSNIEKGKWYVCDTSRYTDFVVGKAYFCPKNGMLKPNENEIARYVAKDCFHLWIIQDAKDGDVLYSHEHNLLWIYKDKDTYYVAINLNYTHNIFNGADMVIPSDVCPATKEQREQLKKAMADAGYVWNAEKKELKKIHVIDEGKAEMDYCFTKMMNGERVSPAWSEEDEEELDIAVSTLKEAGQHDSAKWLKSLKERIGG